MIISPHISVATIAKVYFSLMLWVHCRLVADPVHVFFALGSRQMKDTVDWVTLVAVGKKRSWIMGKHTLAPKVSTWK